MADDKDDKDKSIDNPENLKYTDVGLRQHDDRIKRSEEGIEHPQGEFRVGELERKYESEDIALGPIFKTAAIVVAMTLASYVLMYALYGMWYKPFARDRHESEMMPIQKDASQMPPGPLLQPMLDPTHPDPPGSMVLKSAETNELRAYQAQEQAKVAAMNIDQAIEHVAANGLPTGAEWQMAPGTVMMQGVVMTESEAAAQQQALKAYAQRQGMDMGQAAPTAGSVAAPAPGAAPTPAPPAAAPTTPPTTKAAGAPH